MNEKPPPNPGVYSKRSLGRAPDRQPPCPVCGHTCGHEVACDCDVIQISGAAQLEGEAGGAAPDSIPGGDAA